LRKPETMYQPTLILVANSGAELSGRHL
jgi:hypothetical protein